jgi:hypothetical protein
MRTRPWPLVILALLQFLSPVGTVLINAYALGVKPGYVIGWILSNSPLQIFETLFLMPIAGFAIYQMKRWGYFVFFAAMTWGLISNLLALRHSASPYSLGVVLLLFAIPMLLAVYFLLPAVRRTYFDPSVRWWEAKSRFVLETPVEISTGAAAAEGRIQNISEGGIACTIQRPTFSPGQELKLKFVVAGVVFKIPGIVMHSAAGFYGIRFLHDRVSARRFCQLVQGLELIGVPHRDQDIAKPWHVGVREWALTVLKTGRGLVPEVKHTRKS